MFPGGKSTKRQPAQGKRSVPCDDWKQPQACWQSSAFGRKLRQPDLSRFPQQLLSCQLGKMPVSKYPSHHRPSALPVIEEEGQLQLPFLAHSQHGAFYHKKSVLFSRNGREGRIAVAFLSVFACLLLLSASYRYRGGMKTRHVFWRRSKNTM